MRVLALDPGDHGDGAPWFETMHPPGPAAREMYRMAAEALRREMYE